MTMVTSGISVGPNRRASGSRKKKEYTGVAGGECSRKRRYLEELQECREVDNGVAESTGGTAGRV